MKRKSAFCIAALVSTAPVAFACGFEDPKSADIQRGMLNWVYPDALYVTTAVWQAQTHGLIAREEVPSVSKKLLGQGYRMATAKLGKLRDCLSDVAAGKVPPTFSVVLISPMLWSRYESSATGMTLTIHNSGPSKGNVVIVTDEPVIAALVEGRMTATVAVELGLIRFYGPADKVAELTSLIDGFPTRSSRPTMPATN